MDIVDHQNEPTNKSPKVIDMDIMDHQNEPTDKSPAVMYPLWLLGFVVAI